ncbi:acetylornithine aminotransferase [Campylobacterota bacterium]|nr:acetylornithine aminotransferase [Campylobacterota bacterium]
MTLKERDDKSVLHTYARKDTAFERGEGAKLYDTAGKEYIDFASGIGVNSVGHNNPKLVAAIAEQAGKIIHSSNLYLIEPQIKLAEKLIALCGSDARVFFSNSGAEANECAIKLARKWGEKSGKYKIITLNNSFHGRTIATLKATAQPKFHEHFSPFPDGFIYAKDLADIENKIDDQTAAIMLEPIRGEGGVEPLDFDDLRALDLMLKKRGILLIADEIQCGVFRSGQFTASQVYGIKPEIITFAKGLAGGVPIGAAVTTLKDVFVYGDHGSTFGGNFLSTAAALAALDILSEIYSDGTLAKTIEDFSKSLNLIAAEFPKLFTRISGMGLMVSIVAKTPEIQKQILDAAHENGVLVLRAGSDHIRFLPPLTISKEEIDEGFSRLRQACKTL